MILSDADREKQYVANERYKCITDLYYLCSSYLGYALVERVHRPVCNFFVKKDPEKSFYEQDTVRNRLLLDPRGHFKTTIDVGDIVQWILCFPDIRILISSGAVELAERMLAEVGFHFTSNLKLLAIFPEFRMEQGTDLLVTKFTVPCRANGKLREPTCCVGSAKTIKAGSHYDVEKFDDMVNEVNSINPEQLEKTIQMFDAVVPLLEPGGYKDVIGTRYNESDLYGEIIDRDKKRVKEGNEPEWKVFKRRACTLPFDKNSKILFEADSEGKPRYSYKLLKAIKDDNEYLFNCQYLNDPTPVEDRRFTDALIDSISIPDIHIPYYKRDLGGQMYRTGRIILCWDFAFSSEKDADYTCGVAGFYDGMGRLWIVDLVLGRFGPDELVMEIVRMVLKWRPFDPKLVVEKAGGSQLVEPALRDWMIRMKLPFDIDWVKTHPKRIKNERILGLLPLMKQGKVFFSKSLPQLEEVKKQFVKFPYFRKNDAPDAISRLLDYSTLIDLNPGLFPQDTATTNIVTPGCELLGAGLIG